MMIKNKCLQVNHVVVRVLAVAELVEQPLRLYVQCIPFSLRKRPEPAQPLCRVASGQRDIDQLVAGIRIPAVGEPRAHTRH